MGGAWNISDGENERLFVLSAPLKEPFPPPLSTALSGERPVIKGRSTHLQGGIITGGEPGGRAISRGGEKKKTKDELTKNTSMRCKNSIRDLGKERGNEEMGEGLHAEVFFSSCVWGSVFLFFRPRWWRAEASRKMRNMSECEVLA